MVNFVTRRALAGLAPRVLVVSIRVYFGYRVVVAVLAFVRLGRAGTLSFPVIARGRPPLVSALYLQGQARLR